VAYELPPLPYDYAALEPHIDEATMKLHHDKHHQAYVTNLNGAVEKHPEIGKKSPEELLKDLSASPEDVRKVVQNNGGGHVNHTMFWQIMKPKGGGEALVDLVPVDGVPPGGEVVGAPVLVLEVVGVLPDVVAEDGVAALGDRVVLVGCGDDGEFAALEDEPAPAGTELLGGGFVEELFEAFEVPEVGLDLRRDVA